MIKILNSPPYYKKSRLEKICDLYSQLLGSKELENTEESDVLSPLQGLVIGRVLCLMRLILLDICMVTSLRSRKSRMGIVCRTVLKKIEIPGPQPRRSSILYLRIFRIFVLPPVFQDTSIFRASQTFAGSLPIF